MPKVSDAHRASRREQIIAAALTCFARKGFQRTSMADIVAESGLSPGAIYLHFESKQQIVLEAARTVMARRSVELDEHTLAGADLDPPQLIRTLLGGLREDLVDTRILLQLWGEATVDDDIRGLVAEIFGLLRERMLRYLALWARTRGGVDEATARDWAVRKLPLLLSVAQGFVLQSALLPSFDADGYFDGLGDAFVPPGRTAD
jgi:AcrR family transcriptional regulator